MCKSATLVYGKMELMCSTKLTCRRMELSSNGHNTVQKGKKHEIDAKYEFKK